MIRIAGAAALAVASMASPLLAQVKHPREIKTPALRQVRVPQPKRVQLDNGMVFLLMEDHELPIIRGTARIRGGGRDVGAAKAGLTGILGSSWRTGGTESRTGDQLDEFLESRAAIVETGASDDSTSVSLNVLKADFDTIFPIFLDLLRNPAFRQEKIDLAKTQANTGISRRNDEPGAIATREAIKLGFGPDSPYARQPEYATIASITRDDLLALHKRFVHPNNIILGMVGDFDAAQMEQKLRTAFGSWARGPQAPPPVATVNPSKAGIYYVGREDVNQSSIQLVHGGTMRNNPDYPAIQVLNDILNTDRLFAKIRTEQGLAYMVGGGVGSDWDHPGLFRVQVGTKSGTTMQAIESVRTELAALHSAPFTAEEVLRARESILNAHIFTMDSRAKVLTQMVNLEFYGYPADWYQRYPSLIDKVTPADVARVAKQYVTPDKVALLVVGKEKDFDKPLSGLGTVTPIDVTIPELNAAPSAKPAAPAANSAEGLALLKKVQDFVGGKAKIDAVQSVRTVASATRKTPQGPMDVEIESLTQYPERYRAVVKMPMGEMTMVVTPDASFMSLPGMGVRDLPASQRDNFRADAKSEILTVLKYPERYTFAVSGTEKNARVLEITADAETVRWHVDPASGRVLRKISRGRGPMAQGDQITEYTEWKSFGGIQFPTAASVTSNGEQVGSTQVKSVEVNAAVDNKQFERPAA
ncbi:MAG: insulinase family protein [Thermoanaerobaculia bacterium]|nr:insulinase family protein [Thermoanaerobaculia bacterium]